MKLIFLVFLTLFLFACNKHTSFKPPGWDMRHLWILRDTLTGDTGKFWIASSVVVTRSEWNADSGRYFPTNHIPYCGLKKQLFYFKPVDRDSVTYIVTDTLSMLLRIPEKGLCWTRAPLDNHALSLGLAGNSNLSLFIGRWSWDTRLLHCYRKYDDSPNVQYFVETILSKQP